MIFSHFYIYFDTTDENRQRSVSGGGSSRTIAPSDTNAAELLHRPTSVVSGFLCVYVAFERGVVPVAEKAGGAGALLCVGVCVCWCVRVSAPEPAPLERCRSVPFGVEPRCCCPPNVKLHRSSMGFIFLTSLFARSQLGYEILISLATRLSFVGWAEA